MRRSDNLNSVRCSVEGCGNGHKSRGYCNTHYGQFRRGSVIKPVKPRNMNPSQFCEVVGCSKKTKGLNLCSMHWRRLKKHGDVNTILDQTKPFKKCAKQGCISKSYCQNLCSKHYARDFTLPKKYGVSNTWFYEQEKKQNYACAICKKPETSLWHGEPRELAIDHDHRTGKVRGLLCHRCNKALGEFRDDISLLQSAINYLK